MPKSELPIVIAGMHHSGVTQIGDALERLHPEVHQSEERVNFSKLIRRALAELSGNMSGDGFPAWGWTESGGVHAENLPRDVLDDAIAFANKVNRLSKGPMLADPGATLFLDLWSRLLPKATFILAYRSPWDVAWTIAESREPEFDQHPDYAFRIWSFYNQRVLDFATRNPDRCLLLDIAAASRRRRDFAELLSARLHRRRSTLNAIAVTGFPSAAPASYARLGSLLYPDVAKLAKQLEAVASFSVPDERLRLPARNSGIHRPAASVIVPTFNDGIFLLDSISSVEENAPANIELIIVNDGSTDVFTNEGLGRLSEAGYRVLNQQNQGLAAARNTGVSASKGQAFIPLDVDNRIRPGYIERALEIFRNDAEVAAVYGDRFDFGSRYEEVLVPEFDLDILLRGNFIDACAVIRKDAWHSVGAFDTRMPFQGWEDWDFWLSAAEHGWKLAHVPQVLFEYRVRPNSMLAQTNYPEIKARLRGYILAKHKSLYLKRMVPFLTRLEEEGKHWEQIRDRHHELEDRIRAISDDRDEAFQKSSRLLKERAELTLTNELLIAEKAEVLARIQNMEAALVLEREALAQANERERERIRRKETHLAQSQKEVTVAQEHLATAQQRLTEERRLLASIRVRLGLDEERVTLEKERLAIEKELQRLREEQAAFLGVYGLVEPSFEKESAGLDQGGTNHEDSGADVDVGLPSAEKP